MNDRLNTVSCSVPFQRINAQDAERGEAVSNRSSDCALGRKVAKVAIGVCSVLVIGSLATLAYILATQSPEQEQPYNIGGEIPWGGRNITGFPPSNYTL